MPAFPFTQHAEGTDAHIAALHRFVAKLLQYMGDCCAGSGFSFCPCYSYYLHLLAPRAGKEPGKVIHNHSGMAEHGVVGGNGRILDHDVCPQKILRSMSAGNTHRTSKRKCFHL
ncbi:hypothetical protein SDC9_148466 [bioreactor metagenome]|uniref:Uncharacterized protein n=1 Tax=bioreactor metagenome TaxID=1076179 RepID=A0A645EIV3_9ZZZZ